MIRRIRFLLPALVVSAVLVAGCGGGSKKASSSTSSSHSTPAANTSHSSTSSSSSSSSASTSSSTSSTDGLAALGSLGNPAAAAAICQSSLAKSLHLTGDQTSQLQGYCKAIATAKPGDLKAAEKRLCEAVIKDVVPASEQDAASAACDKL